MKYVLLGGSLLLLSLGVARAEAPAEPSLPAMKSARAWLEIIDSGKLDEAWSAAGEALRAKTDLARWSAEVSKKRGSSAAVACRTGVDFEILSDPDHIGAIFVTRFADGHVIGERVGVVEEDDQKAQVISYKVTAPPKKAAPCG